MVGISLQRYLAPPCHTDGGVVQSARRSGDDPVRLAHIKPEPDSSTVQLAVLIARNCSRERRE